MHTVGMAIPSTEHESLTLTALGDSDRARGRAVSARAAVSVRRWKPGQSIGFNVAEVVPAEVESDEVVIYPMSYDYRIDPLILRRIEVIATSSRRRVVLVETPGITMNFDQPESTSRSTVPLRAYLAAIGGNFGPLAAMQWRAIADTTTIYGSPIRLVGESLGAQSVMSMARLLNVASVDLIEPVNCKPRGIKDMTRVGRSLITVEEPLRLEYAARSRSKGWDVPEVFERSSAANGLVDRRLKRISSQGRWAVASALAMARGLTRELDHVAGGTPIRVWRGADSAACDADSCRDFVTHARRRTGQAQLVLLSLESGRTGHHFLTDLDAAWAFGAELRRRWDAKPDTTR